MRGTFTDNQRPGIACGTEAAASDDYLIGVADGEFQALIAAFLILHLDAVFTDCTAPQVRPVVRPLLATPMLIFALTGAGFGTPMPRIEPPEFIVPATNLASAASTLVPR